MAEGSGGNTAIWVAVITVVGSLLTAVIVNIDKLTSRGEKPGVAASPTAATATQAGPAASTPAMATGDVRDDKHVVAAPPEAETPAQPAPAAPEPVAAPIDLNGEWRDDSGSRFSFEQSGSQYELTQTAISGTLQLFARGTISGRDLSHTFETLPGDTGSCTARINAAANRITGNCLTSDGGWTFVIER